MKRELAENRMASVPPCFGLKALNVKAQAEGLGTRSFIHLEPCKGDTIMPLSLANDCMGTLLGDPGGVPPFQGGWGLLGGIRSQAFSLGYNMTGFQPAATPAQQKPVERLVERILAAKQRDAGADVSALEREIDELVYALYGLQGRHTNMSQSFANHCMDTMLGRADDVPPFQGGRELLCDPHSQAFSLGYNMTGFQPAELEREIDELVYALYGLTPEEIKIVEGGGGKG